MRRSVFPAKLGQIVPRESEGAFFSVMLPAKARNPVSQKRLDLGNDDSEILDRPVKPGDDTQLLVENAG
jgi:hypothetical protein